MKHLKDMIVKLAYFALCKTVGKCRYYRDRRGVVMRREYHLTGYVEFDGTEVPGTAGIMRTVSEVPWIGY